MMTHFCAFDSRLRCHHFIVAMKISQPSAPISSSDCSSSRESLYLQSRVRAVEAFIQANCPSGSTSDSSRVAPLLPINLGKSDMVLPAMRTSSTETFLGDNTITAANSGKSFVDQLDTLGGVNNTGGCVLDTAVFASRAAAGDFTASNQGPAIFSPSSASSSTATPR